MKIPKFESVTGGIAKVIKRFPCSMLSALVGTISAYMIIHLDFSYDRSLWDRLLMVSALGFLLFTIVQVWLERNDLKDRWKYLMNGAVVLFLAVYFWFLPENFGIAPNAFLVRFAILLVSLLLLSAFVPFIRNLNEVNGFWQYIKTLFVRFFLTFVFTGSLFLGLVLALVAADQLLGFKLEEKIFPEMWVMVAGLISTTFFLLGIPEKMADLEKKTDYHRAIKIFAQYILIPLLLIYALILYVYTGKIIIHWNWPDGMVSWLIIVFSVGTILANFLLFPLIKKEKWVPAFSRISYSLMIPMTVVMYLAMKIRVDDYGVTEMRYYGIALCVWLLVVASYFVFSKRKNYIYLPVSLFIIAVISLAGPLSSINVSTWSQLGRLRSALTENGLLVNGRAEKTDKKLPAKDITTIHGTLEYLIDVHGFTVIQPWFKEDLITLQKSLKCYRSQCATELLGVTSQVDSLDNGYRSYDVNETEALRIDGYKEILPFYLDPTGPDGNMIFSGGDYRIFLFQKGLRIEVTMKDKRKIEVDMGPFIAKLAQSTIQMRSWDDMRIDSGEIGLVFRGFSFHQTDAGVIDTVSAGNGYLLVK